MKIKEIQAWQWKCPFCHAEGISISHDEADIDLRSHIAGCYKNPVNKICGSCINSKGVKCSKYKTGFYARFLYHDADYNCLGWECKPHLKKIQDKLRGEK